MKAAAAGAAPIAAAVGAPLLTCAAERDGEPARLVDAAPAPTSQTIDVDGGYHAVN